MISDSLDASFGISFSASPGCKCDVKPCMSIMEEKNEISSDTLNYSMRIYIYININAYIYNIYICIVSIDIEICKYISI